MPFFSLVTGRNHAVQGLNVRIRSIGLSILVHEATLLPRAV
jgi:hypothetical protein